MEQLKPKEQEMYDYICQVLRRSGFAPTVREIQDALGIKSTCTVHSYIDRLEQKGYIKKSPGKSRTIRTSEVDSQVRGETVRIPLVGQVAAGTPILATENIERHIDFQFTGRAYNPNELYALRVKGSSMIGVGIHSGDIIIVRKQSHAENGQIVVALLEDEATVKTFYKENGHFRLQPENDTMQPIIVKELAILGKVVACIKYFE